MKYIKLFEEVNKDFNWKETPYVFVDVSNIVDEKDYLPKSGDLKLPGKIVAKFEDSFPYSIIFLNGAEYLFDRQEIIRTLDSEEIEDFEIKLQSNKYNI